jgi:addiction module HigA family antidote
MTDSLNPQPDMIADNITPFEPTHPGEVLRDELAERKISQAQFAKQIGVTASLVNEIINGKRAVSTEYALLFEAALGVDADFWLNMQANYNKHKVISDTSFMERLAKIRRIAVL